MNEATSQLPAPLDTILTLPTETSGAELANRCREAALEFINDSKHWGKAELETWLFATYGPITKHTTRNQGAIWPLPLLREIDVRLIHRIVQSARAEILESLARIASDGSASFVLRALIVGTVMRCEDGNGDPTWAPTGEASRLADRVLSLFAVDYLARPSDYEAELVVCSRCETVSFEGSARTRGVCRQHGQGQSILAPRRHSTIPYSPLGA